MSEITPDSLMVGNKKRGRPQAAEPRASVSAWIPERQLDCVIKLANASGLSVSAFIGQLVQREVKNR